ncbi:MAG: VWA domain-containing protein [Thermoanaerobaculia bacterium]
MRSFASAVALVLLSSPFALAQDFGPLPPLTAHVDVNIVNVDVTVTGPDGKPVSDLTRSDFQIFEDGKPQVVTNFSMIQNLASRTDRAETGTAVVTGKPDEIPRKVMLLVDNNHIEVVERNRALRTVEKYLGSRFPAEWAVATIGHTVQLIQPFTRDVASLHAAFDRVRHMPTSFVQQEVDRSILSDRTRKYLDFATEYDYGESMRFSSREQTYRAMMTMQNTARAVVDTARSYSADEGKKFMVLLTGGMEINTTFTAYSKGKPDGELEQVRLDMAKVLDAMVREANAANFTIHVVNARSRGMQAPQHDVSNRSSGINLDGASLYRGRWGSDPIDVADVDSAPLSIALGTGGMYLPSSDLNESLERINVRTSNFYSLGYSPSHTGDRLYHNIKVRVSRPGVSVANRVGYYDLSSDDRLEEMLRARMTFERDTGKLPVHMEIGSARRTERSMVVPVQAALPMDRVTLLQRDDHYVGRVHVYLSVFDQNGRNVGFHHQTQEVTLSSALHESRNANTFRYNMNVRLQKGEFTVAMTLRDELSNELGSVIRKVHL